MAHPVLHVQYKMEENNENYTMHSGYKKCTLLLKLQVFKKRTKKYSE